MKPMKTTRYKVINFKPPPQRKTLDFHHFIDKSKRKTRVEIDLRREQRSLQDNRRQIIQSRCNKNSWKFFTSVDN
jgi:predicted unusual protein kinase regulating ubiquinone biosynthesis (AarF/ABC1/UbiB family)